MTYINQLADPIGIVFGYVTCMFLDDGMVLDRFSYLTKLSGEVSLFGKRKSNRESSSSPVARSCSALPRAVFLNHMAALTGHNSLYA